MAMEKRDSRASANAEFLKAFVGCDVRVSIDDLNLVVSYHFKHPKSALIRFYAVGNLPINVLAVLHLESEHG